MYVCVCLRAHRRGGVCTCFKMRVAANLEQHKLNVYFLVGVHVC